MEIQADGRLRQVFFNLMDNAIKYTPEGGTIEIRIERTDGTARVIVKDSGIRIPAEHLACLRSLLSVDKAAAEERGTGLGLTIVRSSSSRMAGRRTDQHSTSGHNFHCDPAVRRDFAVGSSPAESKATPYLHECFLLFPSSRS